MRKDKEFMTPRIKYFVLLPLVLAVTVFLLAVPTSFFGIDGLTVVQQRVIALFVFAALMWMTEIIPNWTTSLLVVVLALLTPVLASMPADDPGKGALALSIPLAANLGGIGTTIGTPPNAIAAGTGLVRSRDMARIGLLVGIIGFLFGFVWLTKLFPF